MTNSVKASPRSSTIDTEKAQSKVVFEANPGPQTEFLASSEQEVLFGGAAGGEHKSEFTPPFAVMRQNKTRELLET